MQIKIGKIIYGTFATLVLSGAICFQSASAQSSDDPLSLTTGGDGATFNLFDNSAVEKTPDAPVEEGVTVSEGDDSITIKDITPDNIPDELPGIDKDEPENEKSNQDESVLTPESGLEPETEPDSEPDSDSDSDSDSEYSIYEEAFENGRAYGYNVGYDDGCYREDHAEIENTGDGLGGYNDGYFEGYTEGYETGYADGETECEEVENSVKTTTSLLPIGDSSFFGLFNVIGQTNPNSEEFALITNIADPGLRGLVYIVLWFYDLGRYLLGAAILLFGAIASYHLVASNGKEEDISRSKRFFLWSAIGMIIFSLSWPMKDIFLIRGGNFFLAGDNIEHTASMFSGVFYYALQFFKYIMGGIAVFFITSSGLKLVAYSESGDVVEQQKKVFLWGLIGLIIFMISGELVSTMFGNYSTVTGEIEVNPDYYSGSDLLVGISGFLLYFIGALALLGIVVAAILYVTSGENEAGRENAKKIIIGSITGIVIAYVSYTVVAEIISAIS